jgi:hypothetical protein
MMWCLWFFDPLAFGFRQNDSAAIGSYQYRGANISQMGDTPHSPSAI